MEKLTAGHCPACLLEDNERLQAEVEHSDKVAADEIEKRMAAEAALDKHEADAVSSAPPYYRFWQEQKACIDAALALHTQTDICEDWDGYCQECSGEDAVSWPCPTVKALKSEVE